LGSRRFDVNNAKRAVAVEAELVVERKQEGRELTLFLEGELGSGELQGLGEHFLRLAARGIRHLTVDLSDVSHMDYRGLPPLIDRATQFRTLGGDVRLTGLSPYLATILRVAGAHTVFACYREPSSVREAYSGRSKLAH
jgi:anti-anti-sigma factor